MINAHATEKRSEYRISHDVCSCIIRKEWGSYHNFNVATSMFSAHSAHVEVDVRCHSLVFYTQTRRLAQTMEIDDISVRHSYTAHICQRCARLVLCEPWRTHLCIVAVRHSWHRKSQAQESCSER